MPEVLESAQQLEFALEALIHTLREKVGSQEPEPNRIETAAGLPAVEATLDQLETLLASADFAAGAFCERNAVAIRPVRGDAVSLFEQQLRHYDYPNALDPLRLVRTRIGRGATA